MRPRTVPAALAFAAQLSVLSAASEEWPSGKLVKAKHRKARGAEDKIAPKIRIGFEQAWTKYWQSRKSG